MKKQDAIDLAGSPTALARLLGITAGAITQWGDDVPDARIWQLKVVKPLWFKQPRKQRQAQASTAASSCT